tara:strand:+ start:552 stop:659 length:108 start_codon:yes stop_codon:yes gene_type:complete
MGDISYIWRLGKIPPKSLRKLLKEIEKKEVNDDQK